MAPIAVSSSAAADAAAVGLMTATAALLREASRGGVRSDFPHRSCLIHRLAPRLSAGDVVARFVPAHVAVGV